MIKLIWFALLVLTVISVALYIKKQNLRKMLVAVSLLVASTSGVAFYIFYTEFLMIRETVSSLISMGWGIGCGILFYQLINKIVKDSQD